MIVPGPAASEGVYTGSLLCDEVIISVLPSLVGKHAAFLYFGTGGILGGGPLPPFSSRGAAEGLGAVDLCLFSEL